MKLVFQQENFQPELLPACFDHTKQVKVQRNRELRYYHVSGIAHCSLSFQLLLLLKYHLSNITLFSSLLLLKGNTMATSQLLTDTKKFDEMIVDVITD